MSANVYENAPRYTAKEIEDGLYSGMDPDVELVAAQYYDALRAELARATRALERAGFMDNGAQEWKPPIGWGDTGTLSQRLMATQAELARVKAESLRVVPVGDQCELRDVDWDNHMAWRRGTVFQRDRYGDWWNLDFHDHIEKLDDLDTIVQPVRLERWEDE